MSVTALALGLMEVIPAVVGWFTDDETGEVAEKVIDTAKTLTGISDPTEAVEAIKANPDLQVQLQMAMAPVLIAKYKSEADQQAEINKTMRAEQYSKNIYKSGWRPFFGWMVGISFGIQMIGFVVVLLTVIIKDIARAAEVIQAVSMAVGALMVMWGAAFAALGININKRSQDKQLAAGHVPMPGLLTTLAAGLLGKRDQ